MIDFEQLKDAHNAITILRELIYEPSHVWDCAHAWVELDYPREPAMNALIRLLDDNPDCRWTYRHTSLRPTAIGFADPKHAVMFKLMLP